MPKSMLRNKIEFIRKILESKNTTFFEKDIPFILKELEINLENVALLKNKDGEIIAKTNTEDKNLTLNIQRLEESLRIREKLDIKEKISNFRQYMTHDLSTIRDIVENKFNLLELIFYCFQDINFTTVFTIHDIQQILFDIFDCADNCILCYNYSDTLYNLHKDPCKSCPVKKVYKKTCFELPISRKMTKIVDGLEEEHIRKSTWSAIICYHEDWVKSFEEYVKAYKEFLINYPQS